MAEEKTEEKSKTELEKTVKKMVIMMIAGAVLVLIGALIVLLAIMMPLNTMLPDNEHITDSGMPVRDLDNATYTWTADEIEKTLSTQSDYFMVGLVFVAPGFALVYGTLLIMPSEKKLHSIGCKKPKDHQFCPECGAANKYCPECGLKLSRLEKD